MWLKNMVLLMKAQCIGIEVTMLKIPEIEKNRSLNCKYFAQRLFNRSKNDLNMNIYLSKYFDYRVGKLFMVGN